MKQFFSLIFLSVTFSAFAQQGKSTVSSALQKSDLKTLTDSVSYAVGVSVANFYKQQGIKAMNSELVANAINDVFSGKLPLLDDKTCNDVMMTYLNKIEEEKAKVHLDEGKNFLEENKKQPGVKTTASGLQYEILTSTTGPKPIATDSVTCHYRGTLINGFVFDESYKRGAPITFALNGVIAGWTEGLQLMSAGSKFKFYIPYNLAYGLYDNNSIPGGSTLIFEVELLSFKK